MERAREDEAASPTRTGRPARLGAMSRPCGARSAGELRPVAAAGAGAE